MIKKISDLRIAFLAGNLGQGGAERQLFYIIRALIRQGCSPDVFTFSESGYWEKPIHDLGARVIYIHQSGKIQRLVMLLKMVKRGNYHYIHSQQFYLNLYALSLSWLRGATSIGSVRSNLISEIRDMGLLGWPSLMLPTHVVVNSKGGITNIKKYFGNFKNTYYLPNVVDTNLFFPNRQARSGKTFKVIVVGTVWRPKRIDRVIEIAALVQRWGKNNIVFEIFGDGDQLDEMTYLAKSKGILNVNLFFKGRSANIAADLRAADLLLLTSDFEGMPNVVLEAMSSGLPVVASSVGDVPELVIDGETGYCFEKEQIGDMALAIQKLSEEPATMVSMGNNARDLIEKNYAPENLTERLARLYLQ